MSPLLSLNGLLYVPPPPPLQSLRCTDIAKELDFFKEKNWLRKPNGVYRMPILQTTTLPLQPKKDPKNTPE